MKTLDLDDGDREYFDPPLLLTANHDIHAATVDVCLGAWGESGRWEPGTWLNSTDPSVIITRPTPQSVQVTMLIGDAVRPSPGRWWLGVRVTDTTEVIVRRSTSVVQVFNSGAVNYALPEYTPPPTAQYTPAQFAPLDSPHFTGTPLLNGSPIGVSAPVGASQLVPTPTKTVNYTASVNDLAVFDTSSVSVNPVCTLPTAPADKSQVGVALVAISNGVKVTVAAGGSDGITRPASTSFDVYVAGEVVVFQYDQALALWVQVSVGILGPGGRVSPVLLGSGTRNGTNYLRDDGTWAPLGGGAASGFSDFADITGYFATYGGDKNGTTSCTAAFNAALAANDSIWAPAGNYRFDSPLDPLFVPKMIVGAGYKSTFFLTTTQFATNYPGQPLLNFRGFGSPQDATVLDQQTFTTAGNYTLCLGTPYATGSEPFLADGVTRYSGAQASGAPYVPGLNQGAVKIHLVLGTLTGTGTGQLIVEQSDDDKFLTGVTTAGTINFDQTNTNTNLDFNPTHQQTAITGKWVRCRLNLAGTPTSWSIRVDVAGANYSAVQGVVLEGFCINANGAGVTDDYGRWNTSGIFLDRCKMVTVRDVWLNKQQYGIRCEELYDSYFSNVKTLKCGQSGFGDLPTAAVQTVTVSGTGSFTLTGGVGSTATTAAIPIAGLTSAILKTAIAALPGITPTQFKVAITGVAVSGTGPYTVTFWDRLGPVPTLTVDNTGVTGGPVTVASVATGNAKLTGLPVHAAATLTGYNSYSKGNSDNSTFIQWHFEDNKHIGLRLGFGNRRLRFFGCKWHGDLASTQIMTWQPSLRIESAFTNEFFGCAFNRAGASHVELDVASMGNLSAAKLGLPGANRNNFQGTYFDSAGTNPDVVTPPSINIISGEFNRFGGGSTWSSNPLVAKVTAGLRDNKFDESCDFHDIYSYLNVRTGTLASEFTGPCFVQWRDPDTGLRYTYDGTTLGTVGNAGIYATFSAPAGAVAVQTGTYSFYVNEACTIIGTRASVSSAPTGSSLIVDIKKNTTSIFNVTTANRPTIAAGAITGVGAAPDTVTLAAGDRIQVDVLQVGSTLPGSNLTVQVELQRV